jgi:hypothetical protein
VSDDENTPALEARQPEAPPEARQPEAQAIGAKFAGAGDLSAGTADGYWKHVKVWLRYDKPVGRRSSRNLIRVEAQHRLDTGEVPATLKEFGNDLSTWLADNHPDAPSMSGERVEKCVRDLWHAAGGGR